MFDRLIARTAGLAACGLMVTAAASAECPMDLGARSQPTHSVYGTITMMTGNPRTKLLRTGWPKTGRNTASLL